MHLILSLPGACKVRLSQGLLGADSPKPTELLVANLPDVETSVCAWRITPDLPRHSNIGRDAHGTFRTTQLTEYPPAFCAALAECTVSAFSNMAADPEIDIDSSFLSRCQQMVRRDFGTHIGPDHAS